jgi:hypothetical protein
MQWVLQGVAALSGAAEASVDVIGSDQDSDDSVAFPEENGVFDEDDHPDSRQTEFANVVAILMNENDFKVYTQIHDLPPMGSAYSNADKQSLRAYARKTLPISGMNFLTGLNLISIARII